MSDGAGAAPRLMCVGWLSMLAVTALASCAHVDPPVLANRRADAALDELPNPRSDGTAGISRIDRQRANRPPVQSTDTEAASPTAWADRRESDLIEPTSFDEPFIEPERNVQQVSAPPHIPTVMMLEPEADEHAVDLAPPALTLADWEEMALANNPTLAQLAAVVDKARGIRRQVGLVPNPTIGYMGEEMGDDGTAGMQGGFISQTIVTGDKLQLNRTLASHDVQALSWDLEAQRFRIRNDVRSQFYATLGAQERLSIASDLVKVAEDGVSAAVELEKAKIVARPDILQAEIQLFEVLIVRENAEAEFEAAWRTLAALAGRPDLRPTPLAGTLDGGELDGWSWDAAYGELLASSPELQAAQARVSRAQAQVRRQQAQVVPNLQVNVGVAHNNSNGDDIATVQVGVPLPVFNRNQGNIDVACAEYHRAISDVERLRLALQARLAGVFRDYRQAARQVERYQTSILPKAQENLDLTTEGYRHGQLDLLRVLTARRSYFEAKLAAVRSHIALRQAEVSLSGFVLTGGLSDVVDIAAGSGGVDNRGTALSGQ